MLTSNSSELLTKLIFLYYFSSSSSSSSSRPPSSPPPDAKCLFASCGPFSSTCRRAALQRVTFQEVWKAVVRKLRAAVLMIDSDTRSTARSISCMIVTANCFVFLACFCQDGLLCLRNCTCGLHEDIGQHDVVVLQSRGSGTTGRTHRCTDGRP